MKIIVIYIVMAALTLCSIVGTDILAGGNLQDSLHSMYSVFATTTLQENICMALFLALPVIEVIAGAMRRRSSR